MADDQNKSQFTIEQFLDLLGKSDAAALLPVEMKLQMDQAIATGDMGTLQRIYDILIAEKDYGKKIVADFSVAKEKIMDRYMVTVTDIRKKYTEGPMKEKIAAATVEEETMADQMLNNL